MYADQYVHYVNFPAPPKDLIDSISLDLSQYKNAAPGAANPHTYFWTDEHNKEINEWGKKNICGEWYFAFQFMTGYSALHKDTSSKIKINYIIATGGSQVYTEFFDDTKQTKLMRYQIEPNRWHLFKADVFHQVIGIEPNNFRFAITAKVF
jgi:hypothetical protein